MKRKFLDKFFPASIRKDISGIRQSQGESILEYWERFNKLCASCPNHHIREQLLLNNSISDSLLLIEICWMLLAGESSWIKHPL